MAAWSGCWLLVRSSLELGGQGQRPDDEEAVIDEGLDLRVLQWNDGLRGVADRRKHVAEGVAARHDARVLKAPRIRIRSRGFDPAD